MKKCIKNLATAMMVAGAVMASHSAFAQVAFVKNDLYVGFENAAGGGTADYIVNVGTVSNLVGEASVINLSADFLESDFNSTALKGTSASGILGGVVGATDANNPADVFATVLRTSNIGIPSVAGSTAPGGLSRSQDDSVEADLSSLVTPAAGAGVLDTTKSWESAVEPTFTANSFYGASGINPDSSVTTGAVVYEDLWDSSSSSLSGTKPFTYEGYFTFNFTGASAVVTFTPSAAPDQLTAPKILSISKANNTVTVVSTAVPTFHYQLQSTASLQPTNWVNVGSAVLATTTLVTNTDTSATASIKYYQISAH
jgi:hypothetical protein